MIADPFPEPAASIQLVLEQLHILRRGDADEIAAAGGLHHVPRPWDPATCPEELRSIIWSWCDSVAVWINHEYTWKPSQMIPACWPHHPHIARELAVLALLRWTAEQSRAPEPVEEWHRYTYPMFSDRMTSRLGESTCRNGKHIPWPADARHAAFTGPDATEDRQALIFAETNPPAPIRALRRS